MEQKRFWKWAGPVCLIGLILFTLAPVALAFESRSGDTVVIGADEVIADDLYVGAGTFTLDGTVKGDLVVFGGTIEINGTVEGDLIAAGQTIAVKGTVMDDARIAGQALTLSEGAQVGDDVVAAGFSIEGKKGSAVGGDLIYAGYQALLAGDVARNLNVAAGGLQLNGSVGGDVKAEVGEPEEGPSPRFFMPGAPAMPLVPMGLTVDRGARIGGKLDYTSASEWNIPAGVVAGIITHHQPEVKAKEKVVSPGSQLLGHLQRLVALLLVGLLVVWLVPGWTRRVADALQARPLPSLGWGVVTIAVVCLALLVILVAMILLAVVLGLVKLGNLVGTVMVVSLLAIFALAVLFGLTIAYFAKIFVSFLGGRLILGLLKRGWAEGRIWPLVVGVVLFVILTAIPYLGGLINLVVVLMGLGALGLLGRDLYRQRRAVPVESQT